MTKRVFDPTGQVGSRDHRVDISNVRCPCGGLCFDVTPGLAHWMGVRHYECDKCRARYAKQVSPGLEATP